MVPDEPKTDAELLEEIRTLDPISRAVKLKRLAEAKKLAQATEQLARTVTVSGRRG